MEAPVTVPRDVLARLAVPSGARFAAAAAVDWLIIVAVFLVVDWLDHPAAYVLALIPLGSRQQALGALFHDAAHGLASRRPWLNELLGGALAAWPLGLTLGGYRRYHLAHHRHLGTARDPEMRHKAALPHWRLPASPLRVALGFGSDLVLGGVPHLLYATHMTRPVRAWEVPALGVFWAAVLAGFWALGALWVPVLFVFSIATVFWSGVRLRIWTEHTGSTGTHRIGMPSWFSLVVMPHDIGLHWEHHLYPTVPFFRLAELRREIDRVGGAPAVVPLQSLVRSFFRARSATSGALAGSIEANEFADDETLARSRGELRALRFGGHVLLPLSLGALAYLTTRRRLPMLLDWFPWGGRLRGVFPSWFEASFPDAAWAYAAMSAVLILWDGAPRARFAWAVCTFAVVCLAELAQRPGWIPGTFDPRDLAFSVAASAAAVILSPRGADWLRLPETER